MSPQTLTIVIPDQYWWTSNTRIHYHEQARRTKGVREIAGWATKAAHLKPAPQAVEVLATIYYSHHRTADPANASPMVKAIMDGCTDAGLWPDDDSRHVVLVAYRRGETTCQRGTHQVQLEISEARHG